MDSRTILYWLSMQPSAPVDIVFQNITDIMTHEGHQMFPAEINLENFNLTSIYYLKTHEQSRVTTLVSDKEQYYLVDNELQEDKVSSRIWYHRSPVGLLAMLPEDIVTYLNFKSLKHIQANLSNKDKQALAGVLPFDFAQATHEEQVNLWRQYTEDKTDHLDLTGFYTIDSSIIGQAKAKSLVLNRNYNLHGSFSWLANFPQLTTLSIWRSNITDKSFENINEYASALTILEMHECPLVTGRCLIDLAKIPQLEKLIIDNDRCRLQDTTFETVITEEEWKVIRTDSLNTLFINSGNLTLDFIDYCLKSFRNLTNFIMHEQMIQKLYKNSRDGHTEHKISFHNASNIQEGFARFACVKILNLMRNQIMPAFSECMLRKIQERDPTKVNIAQEMLGVSDLPEKNSV